MADTDCSKNSKVIFLDLDGTILDVLPRSYQVYSDILARLGKAALPYADYAQLKKEKTPVAEILEKTGAGGDKDIFSKQWLENIEKSDYLGIDRVSEEKKRHLQSWKADYRLVLVTLRDDRDGLARQLKDKNIDRLFDAVISESGRGCSEAWKLKASLIKEFGAFGAGSIIVGDTETDILAGKENGLFTVAVGGGMRSREYLEEYAPDLFVGDLTQFDPLKMADKF